MNDLNPAGVDAAAQCCPRCRSRDYDIGVEAGWYTAECNDCGWHGGAYRTEKAARASLVRASLPQPEGETATCKEGLQVQSEEMAELVERLRRKTIVKARGYPLAWASDPDPDCIKAADAITGLSQRLAVAEARLAVVEAERDEARRDNERDRTIIIEARNAIHDAVVRRSWLLSGGRGSYEWDDQRFRDEFAAAMEEIGKPLAILDRLGVNWANCPTAPEEIKAARIDWKARADAAEAQLAHAREAAIEECAKVADEHAETWGAAMASPAIVIAAAIRAMKGGGE